MYSLGMPPLDYPKTLAGTVPATVPAALAGTLPKMLFIYPRLLGRIQVPGVAPILQNNQDTQDPQHAGDPSYLGVGGFLARMVCRLLILH